MAHTRAEFSEYCLRALGAPVLEINVDADQLEDRIDEALEYWRLYHHEGIEQIYLKTLINVSTLNIITSNADQTIVGSIVTGQISGATANVTIQQDRSSTGNTILVRGVIGTFVAGEDLVFTNPDTGLTSTLSTTDFYTEGETEKKYLDIPDSVYGISRVLPISEQTSSKSMFDIQYQMRLNDLYNLTSTSVIYYTQVMGHMALLNMQLNGNPIFRFNRLSNKLYIDTDWESNIIPGSYILVEAYRAMDPSVFPRIWNEPWLKHYCTALFKRQWGQNLSKFSGLQLPGGVSLDGGAMYDAAMSEIEKLETELVNKSAPLCFFMG
jgi:hypothetical protein